MFKPVSVVTLSMDIKLFSFPRDHQASGLIGDLCVSIGRLGDTGFRDLIRLVLISVTLGFNKTYKSYPIRLIFGLYITSIFFFGRE